MRGFHIGFSFLICMARSVVSSFMSVSRVWAFLWALMRGMFIFVWKNLLRACMSFDDSGYFRNIRGDLPFPYSGLKSCQVRIFAC